MKPIVIECLTKHIGGENYFNELDGMIKNNEILLVLFLMYAVQDSGVYNVILSGEIGIKYIQLQLKNKIPDYINLMAVNGGLRRGNDVVGGIASKCSLIPDDFDDDIVIFIDDSFYSGKTANKVKEFINSRAGEVVRTYVFYDGCKVKHEDVMSLYRYYD